MRPITLFDHVSIEDSTRETNRASPPLILTMKNRDREGANDGVYLITFACYGAHLPGQPGAIDRNQNLFGSPSAKENTIKETEAGQKMNQEPYLLDVTRREVVLHSLQEVCKHRNWTLLAAHVRSNHVHTVVAADETAERVMNTFKAYASRELNTASLDSADRRRWARHGSTRHLHNRESITVAMHYVVSEQGNPMAVFCASSAAY